MSYLSEAFEPLLSNNKQSRGLDVFKKDWYNYDTERTSDNSTLKLSTMVPSLNRLNFDLNKPIKDNKKYCKRHEQSDFLFSFFFKEWSERDLLICILLFQLLLLVTIARK